MYCVDYYNINLQIISEIIVLDKVDTFFFSDNDCYVI